MPKIVNAAITTNTAVVLIMVTAKISLYDCLCVKPVTASKVMTAPLCGKVSIPPDAIDTTRCITSGGIPAAKIAALYVSAIALKAILIPPEAEPVIPAKTVVVTAPFTNGLVKVELKP